MATMSTRETCSLPNTDPNPTIGGTGTPNVSVYEKCREDRIKENLQRMQNLGILDLSLKLKSEIRPVKRSYGKSIRDTPPLQPSSTRRSSRLKNATPVTYCEEIQVRKGKTSKREEEWFGEGERPEIYTEEHEKLLGNTERHWELFVDGYDRNGKRIYDPVNGKTCHQCRQKTLGYRTECCKCNMVQGQFCGDCLYMRYGEHVLEAMENPDWICPACRGICNCSLCRKQKGWLPTGAAYRKISKLGYKSVAHYLIQTKRSETNETETDASVNQASAKRSLSFQASEEQQGLELQDNHLDDDKNLNSAIKLLDFFPSEDNQTSMIDNQVTDELKPQENRSIVVTKMEDFSDFGDVKEEAKETGQRLSLYTSPYGVDDQVTPVISPRKENQVTSVISASKENQETSVVSASKENLETSVISASKENQETSVISASKEDQETSVISASKENLETSVISASKENQETPVISASKENLETAVISASKDNQETSLISARKENQETPVISASKENQERRSKRRVSVEPSPDSIGGRLRQRRKSQA